MDFFSLGLDPILQVLRLTLHEAHSPRAFLTSTDNFGTQPVLRVKNSEGLSRLLYWLPFLVPST